MRMSRIVPSRGHDLIICSCLIGSSTPYQNATKAYYPYYIRGQDSFLGRSILEVGFDQL